MTALEKEFYFKQFRPDTFPLPLAFPVFSIGAKRIELPCILDSGADFTTIPMSIGRDVLGIDFNKIAPYEIRKKWDNLNRQNEKQLNELIQEIIGKKHAIPTSYECACGRTTSGFYYPAEIQIEEFKKEILVLWTPSDVISILGRIGIFDKIEELTFKKGKSYTIKFED